jgi:hypothetical protein
MKSTPAHERFDLSLHHIVMAGLDPASQGHTHLRPNALLQGATTLTFVAIGGEAERAILGGRVKPGHDDFICSLSGA